MDTNPGWALRHGQLYGSSIKKVEIFAWRTSCFFKNGPVFVLLVIRHLFDKE